MSAIRDDPVADPWLIVAELRRERDEALAREAAMAEVLQVINSSPGDLAPVFDAMLEKAMRLCEARFGLLSIIDGEQIRAVAERGVPTAYAEFRRRNDSPATSPIAARVFRGEPFIHSVDLKAEDSYERGDPQRRALVDLGGARTSLVVTLIRDRAVLGAIHIYRTEVQPFSDKQIALLQNFAAQAVIAIENARLITETREALEQQTATAEVLEVINSSPGDLAPVFDAILEKAHSLCAAPCGSLQIFDGELFRAVATRGIPELYASILRQGVRGRTPGDATAQYDFAERAAREPDNPIVRAAIEVAKLRTVLFVPLRKDGVLLGRIAAGRQEVRPFTDKQIALLENFAAQAVIAMENARLLTETREALEQQTATAEVLQVINSSPGDLAPVFEAMLEKALRLCEAAHGHIWRIEGEHAHAVASRGDPHFIEAMRRDGPAELVSERPLGRLARGEHVVHMPDATKEELYRANAGFREFIDSSEIRTAVMVALRKDEALLGAIVVHRKEVLPFTDKQIARCGATPCRAAVLC